FRSTVTERLLRACTDHHSEVPEGSSGCSLRHLRKGSPPSAPSRAGGSILITSAPKSAIIRPAKGPAISWPSSSTRRPASGPAADAPGVAGFAPLSLIEAISWSDGAPVAHRLRDRARVHVFELAAHRHAARQARDLQAAGAQQLADVVRGGLAF